MNNLDNFSYDYHKFNNSEAILDILAQGWLYRISFEGDLNKIKQKDLKYIDKQINNYHSSNNFNYLNKITNKYKCIKEIYDAYNDIYKNKDFFKN